MTFNTALDPAVDLPAEEAAQYPAQPPAETSRDQLRDPANKKSQPPKWRAVAVLLKVSQLIEMTYKRPLGDLNPCYQDENLAS